MELFLIITSSRKTKTSNHKGGFNYEEEKILALVLAASMAGGMLAGCGATSSGDETAKGDKSSGKVYYLNFKPEQADQWVELAKEYTDETGVQVDVQTATSELTSHS